MKDGIKDISDLEASLNAISKELEVMKKHLEKDVVKCLPIVSGKMSGALDMQGNSIVNLPKGVAAHKLVIKGWYAKNYVDISMAIQKKINTIEQKVKSYHTTDRSRRELDSTSDEDQRIDRIKAELIKL